MKKNCKDKFMLSTPPSPPTQVELQEKRRYLLGEMKEKSASDLPATATQALPSESKCWS